MSRWREPDERRRPRGAAGRVAAAQAQARQAIALAGAFVVASVVTAAVDTDLGRWLPLHLFLAGAVVVTISGVSVLLAVTWSAAPAPARWLTATQQALVAGGAAGVAAGRELELGDVALVAAAGAFTAGLVLLAGILAVTAARGVERRFDAAVAWYVSALAASVGGAGLGAWMAVDTIDRSARGAHIALNVLGLVGFVIAGTLPTFVATVGRTRMARRATPVRHGALLVWELAALGAIAGGALADAAGTTAAGLVAYASGLVGVATLLPRPSAAKLRWAGPRLIGLWLGIAWWVAALLAAATTVRPGVPIASPWLLVLVVGGYAQIAWASLSYLVPVLRGGGHRRLSAGFVTTRSWPALVAANIAAVALAAGAGRVAAAALILWVVDVAWRLGTVVTGRDPVLVPDAADADREPM